MPANAVAHAASMSPLPSADAQDLLIVQDVMDTLDQIPPELTRVHSDLNELGAVLYSTLLNLEKKLNSLIDWIQDGSIGPEQRFQLLQEIAEEAARYKLGGDDKIRVAGGACDGIMAHQKHISNLLATSTLLHPAPPSPYSQSLTLSHLPPQSNTRRGVLSRAANSPFGGRGYAPSSGMAGMAGPSGERERDTPTKKKKSRVQQLGTGRDDDDVSSAGGKEREEKKKAPVKKRKLVNRAVSPTDSLGSNSAFTGKPSQPQTARQLAAAASKARKAELDDHSDEDSRDEGERKDGGLGLDVGSREGSYAGARSANDTPILASASVVSGEKSRQSRARSGVKRPRNDDDDDDESEPDEEEVRPIAKRNGSAKKKSAPGYDTAMVESKIAGGEGEVDSKVYCTCRQVSYGEMIGCDDDDCDIEWYHLACLGLDKPPEGNWICSRCIERKKARGRKPAKGGKGRGK